MRKLLKPYYYMKHFIQRGRRGFSDRDMWSADIYLSGVIANILQWYIDNGHGIPMSYRAKDDEYGEDIEFMSDNRDREYAKHIAILKEYNLNGCALDKNWQRKFGGVTEKQIGKTLRWFSRHFTELWD